MQKRSRQFLGSSVTLLTLLSLVACTGTTTAPTPLFLIVGHVRDGQGEVGLIDSRLIRAGVAPEQQGILAGSERLLPHPPVAFDLTNRRGNRNELVVLSRSNQLNDATLSFFGVNSIDENNLAETFVPSRDPVSLSADFPIASELDDSPRNFCPTRVQIGREGRYLALFNSPAACGQTTLQPSIDVIDLQTNTIIFRRVGFVQPQSLYLLQTETNVLYFFDQRATAQPLRVNISLPPPLNFAPYTNRDIPGTAVTNPILETRAAGATLIALRNNDFVAIRDITGTTATVEDPRPTVSGARGIVFNDRENVTPGRYLVFSNNEVVVHNALTSDLQRVNTPSALNDIRSGTVTAQEAAFFVSPGQIGAVDVSRTIPSRGITAFPFPTLTDPRFVTWVEGRLALPGPGE